jgi:TolA-binding protein
MKNDIKIFCTAAALTSLLFIEVAAQNANPRPNIGIGFNLNVQKLYGDTHNGGLKFGGNPVVVRYNFQPFAYLETDVGLSQLSGKLTTGKRDTELWNFGAKLGCRLFNEMSVNPLFYFGLGMFSFDLDGDRYWDGYGAFGGGVEYFVNPNLGLNFTTDYRYTTGDDFDGADTKSRRDGFVNLAIGVNYYLGAQGTERLELKSEKHGNGAAEVVEVNGTGGNGYQGVAKGRASINAQNLRTERLFLERSLADKDEAIRLLRAKKSALMEEWNNLEGKLAVKRDNTKSARDGTSASLFIHKHYRTALLYFEAEAYRDAVLVFKTIIDDNETHPLALSSWYWLGEGHYALQNYRAAGSAFQMVLLKAPNSEKSKMAQLMLGICYWKSGDLEMAGDHFSKVLKAPLNSEYEYLARVYLARLTRNENLP